MKNKKIVMIGPSINSMGGIATVVNGYISAGLFDKWGVIYLNTHVEGSKLKKLSVAVNAMSRLLILLIKRDVALLHVHSAQGVSFWRKFIFMLVALAAKCPVIFHLHGCEFMQFYNDRCGRLAKWLVRFVLRRSSRVVALSSQWKDNLLSIENNANVVCVFNSVLVPETHDVPPQNKRGSILLFLGRLGERKGTYDLLEAISRIKEKYPDVILKCGGDGELDKVAVRIDELGISDNVEILGWVKGSDKQVLLTEAAIYVLPSYNEGLPMGILESMEAGLPVVSSTVGGIPDAIDSGLDGILIKAGDIDALVDAIDTLLSDSELREKMGIAARNKIIKKFSAEKILPQIEDMYRELGAMPVNNKPFN